MKKKVCREGCGVRPRSGPRDIFRDILSRRMCRDLEEMVAKGILEKVGTAGKGVHYRLGKGAVKGPMGP